MKRFTSCVIVSMVISFLAISSCVDLVESLTADEVLNILSLGISDHEEYPVATTSTTSRPVKKQSQAAQLGQLLRKYLSDNFRQLYYELHVINSTLKDMKYVRGVAKDVHEISEIRPKVQAIKESVELIQSVLDPKMKTQYNFTVSVLFNQIQSILKSLENMNLLENISANLNSLKEAYQENSAHLVLTLQTLMEMEENLTNKVEEVHRKMATQRSCMEILLQGNVHSGIYQIWPLTNRNDSVQVYCDMKTDGGGWTVIQRRGVGEIPAEDRPNFNRNFIEYEHGFGNATQDYWLGLENIRSLTRQCDHELLINMTNWDDESRFAWYERFKVASKLDFYRLHVEGFSGSVGDSFLYHNNKQFSTFDEDNDEKWSDDDQRSNCAKMYGGGWWFGDCLKANLNGVYPADGSQGRVEKLSGIRWNSWTPLRYSLKMTEMKIRPIVPCY